MTFLYPLWLTALVPWAGVVAYLLRRRTAIPTAIPFLQLWSSDVTNTAAASRRRMPLPPFVVLLLTAMLLAIAAAAGPARVGVAANVTVVVDRGFTMSVRGNLPALIDALDHQLHAAHVRLLTVPGSPIDTDGRSWAALAKSTGPTAIVIDAQVQQTVTAALARSGDPIIAVTDAPLATDPRVCVVAPHGVIHNVGIATFAVTNGRHPQAMVRLRNLSDAHSARITIAGGGAAVTQAVDLPPPGEDRDVFVDLPGPLSDTVTATLFADHTSPLNDHASVVRASTGPLRWSTGDAVPAAVKKFVDVYTRLRPASADAATAVVRVDDEDWSGTGLWLAADRSSASDAAVEVIPDAITAGVRQWPPPADATVTAPGAWRVLVKRGAAAIVAAAPDGNRIWFNGRLDAWSKTPDFVVLFASVFDAIAAGSATWTAEPPHALGNGWRTERALPTNSVAGEVPAIYEQRARRVAINAPPLPRGAFAGEKIDGVRVPLSSVAAVSIAPWLTAIAALLAAAGGFLYCSAAVQKTVKGRG